MAEIEMIKRDCECNSRKIDELKQDFKNRDPAKSTYKFMSNMTTEMALFKEELKNIAEQNVIQHAEILKRISRIEQFIIGILVLFSLAAVYFIFNKTGLKI
jgi:dGTP triphosphohydrolase